MTSLNLAQNPFKVFTPEDMEAADVHALFVDPFTDFNKIREPGHTMVNGPRGCGKSMILRYLLPDCQTLALKTELKDLPFLAFLVSIKNTGPNLTEFRRLSDRHADIVLNEHVLTVFVAAKVFAALARLPLPGDRSAARETIDYFENRFVRALRACGSVAQSVTLQTPTAIGVLKHITEICDDLYKEVVQYAKRLSYSADEPIPYSGALCGYMDFLFPLLQDLKELSFLPDRTFYLLIDDADYLNRTQTMVLNSWVSTRTQMDVSIKISTQLRYKTHTTVSGIPIQAPHDYQAINVSDIYTTRHSRYMNRLDEIVSKRLKSAGISAAPREFFPADAEQETAIAAIAQRLRSEWHEKGRGHRPEDDAIRYARPEYIRSLGGSSKSTSTYSYAGFDQLVHISSGLVRYFLEPAAVMFDEQRSRNPSKPIAFIEPRIQDEVIRATSDNLMFAEFDTICKEEESDHQLESETPVASETIQRQMNRLRNLICALGGTFYLKLISEDSERRVFSVAISGIADDDVVNVFDLGVRYGYFHRSSIGNKDGTGRTRLYVLTRRLAPHFKLDPSSFAGYLWVSNETFREAMAKPDAVLRKIKRAGVTTYLDSNQLTLFE